MPALSVNRVNGRRGIFFPKKRSSCYDSGSMSGCVNLEKQARTRDLSKIDPIEHKNEGIEFYKQVIHSPNIQPKFKLAAQKQLDHLLGLDRISTEEPEEFAAKVIQFKVAAMATMCGGPINPEDMQKMVLRRKNRANLSIC